MTPTSACSPSCPPPDLAVRAVDVAAQLGQRLADALSDRDGQLPVADRLLEPRQRAQAPGQRHLAAVQRGLLRLDPGRGRTRAVERVQLAVLDVGKPAQHPGAQPLDLDQQLGRVGQRLRSREVGRCLGQHGVDRGHQGRQRRRHRRDRRRRRRIALRHALGDAASRGQGRAEDVLALCLHLFEHMSESTPPTGAVKPLFIREALL